ncbi:DUF4230 domain-containing protein [Ekhidna sp.]|uniref:DUF4230 domain-containing protein n=1 Tax=Ekhidna sp. TaxID=2608089 RepID=UPI003C7C7A03
MKRLIYIVSLLILVTACKDDQGLVVGKIKKASKLATTEFTIDKIVYGVKRKRLLWVVKLNEAKFLAHSKAIVKAGVNLEKLRKEDVDIEGKSISLKLPPVEVINFSYPAELFEMDTLVSTDAFLNRISLNDQEQFFQDAEIDIRNSLKHMKIVEATEKKTRLMLENLLRTLGYQEIYIEFHQGELIPEITEEEVGL